MLFNQYTSVCDICKKYRGIGSHKKCSKIRSQMYQANAQLLEEQEANKQGEREYNKKRNAIPLLDPKKRNGAFSKGTSGRVEN